MVGLCLRPGRSPPTVSRGDVRHFAVGILSQRAVLRAACFPSALVTEDVRVEMEPVFSLGLSATEALSPLPVVDA